MKLFRDWKLLSILILFAWAYLPTLQTLLDIWLNKPQYSHGILVPVFAVFLCYRRFPGAGAAFGKPAPAVAFGFLAAAMLSRVVAGMSDFLWLDGMSLIVGLTSIALLLGGWTALRWTWPGLLFLVFMVPPPYAVEVMLGRDLQRLATVCSTFVLQTLGQPAVSEGNIILIGELQLSVEEACSGLRMLITFVAFSVAAVFLLDDRTRIEKGIILLSAVPIALATNVIRVSTTGLAYIYLGEESGLSEFLHELYGYFMMPVGLGLLMLELWLLRNLLIQPEPAKASR